MKNSLFSSFEHELDSYTLTPRQIVLAFSGGIDSRVMLDLLATYRDIHPQHSYLVIHIHHGLSPYAQEWLIKCQSWAKEADLPFLGLRVCLDLKGQSIEKVAREARYQAIKSKIKPQALVLTAQHFDDQVETFLLALKRGSGPTGLAGMPQIRPFGEGLLLRPFLNITREQIEQYAKQQGLLWLEDESNQDERFDRNFIRHSWLPLAKERWPAISKSIYRAARFCAEQESLLDELLAEHLYQAMQSDGGLSIAAISQYSVKMQSALIRRWYKKQTNTALSQAQLQQVFQCVISAADDANPKMTMSCWQLRRYQQVIYVIPQFSDVSSWQENIIVDQKLELPDGLGFLTLSSQKTNSSHQLMLSAAHLNQPIRVCFDGQGIVAHPCGRQGRRKLKKLYQEYGVPSWLRKRTPLIFYGDKLAAVAGLFVCDGFAGQTYQLLWSQ